MYGEGWFGRGAEELQSVEVSVCRGVCGVLVQGLLLEGRSEVKRTDKDFIVQEVEERQRAARGAASPIPVLSTHSIHSPDPPPLDAVIGHVGRR